jgi:prolyl-tRNA editing enzyme YbaK/EbsC (Cys-tRNA(Pro) deacylase)
VHPRAEEFARRARAEHGLSVDVAEFPAGTKTAADAAAEVGCPVGAIASSIVLVAGDDVVVAVTSGANRVSTEGVAAHLDLPPDAVALADADRVRETVGWAIGGVPPVCHDADVPVLFDPALTAYETVWAAAGTPTAVFPVAPAALVAAADATVVDVTE